jgi:tetratricopeptide (TPR) repeat protein
MAAGSSATNTAQQKTDWYKWIAGIGIPIIVAIIGLFKGCPQKPSINSLTLVTDVAVIENQYQEATGQPLTDEATKQLILQAVAAAKSGNAGESLRLFNQLAGNVSVPAVYNNIGSLEAKTGNIAGAQQAYKRALEKNPNYAPAQKNAQMLAELKSSRVESVQKQEANPDSSASAEGMLGQKAPLPEGGRSFEQAVTIKPGLYLSTEKLEGGAFQYFKMYLRAGQTIVVKLRTDEKGSVADMGIYDGDGGAKPRASVCCGGNLLDTTEWSPGVDGWVYLSIGGSLGNSANTVYRIAIK